MIDIESSIIKKIDTEDFEILLGKYLSNNEEATDAEILEFIRQSVPSYMAPTEKFVKEILKNRKTLFRLRRLPHIPQRSPEWYALRNNRLTASDLAQALGRGKYGTRSTLVDNKAFPKEFTASSCPPLVWGNRYEDVAAMCYRKMRGDVPLYEFGLIPHSDCKVFGASPDGITGLGVMLEIKCPYKRKIKYGEVPEQYAFQIQGQLEVCNLDYCDYIECVLKEHQSHEFELLGPEKKYLGIVAHCYGKDKYIYSPYELNTVEELLKWKADTLQRLPDSIMCFYHWSLEDYNLVRVKRDRELFARLRPQIEDFWNDVEKHRVNPVKPEPKVSTRKRKETEFAFIDDDNSQGFAFID